MAQISTALIDRVKRHEGFSPNPKQDGARWEIGYGHDINLPSDVQSPWVEEAASAQLTRDLNNAAYACTRQFSWFGQLSALRQEVMIEMVFQLGMDGVLKFSRMLMRLSNGDYAGAASEMLLSKWRYETPARCEELSEIMSTDNA